jgi:hypothetical protein
MQDLFPELREVLPYLILISWHIEGVEGTASAIHVRASHQEIRIATDANGHSSI